MSTAALMTEIKALPPELRQEVEDFVAFLKTKRSSVVSHVEREFGYARGNVRLSDDFDAPLDDFEGYV